MLRNTVLSRFDGAVMVLAISAQAAAAACPPGQELKTDCFQWGHEVKCGKVWTFLWAVSVTRRG